MSAKPFLFKQILRDELREEMVSIRIRLKRLMRIVIWGGTGEHHDVEIVRRIILINIISAIGILCLIPLGISAIRTGNFTLGIFDLVVGVVLIANQILLRKTGQYLSSIYLGVGSAGALFFYLFVTGGIDNTGHLWLYAFPLFASFLLGSRNGAMATFLLFSTSMMYITANSDSPNIANYSMGFKIRLTMSFLVVFAYAHFFETVRESTQKRLSDKNTELQNEVTERTRAQEDLKIAKEMAETANQAKSDFLANMSHELRTPMNHIMGFTALVVDKNFGDLNETQEEYLNDVLSSSKHLLSLINDILDLSKVEAGKMELEVAEVDLKYLLESSLVLIKEKAMKHGIQLTTDFNGIPETITADERKLKQIMYNLLSNAVKFTAKGGEIRLTANVADSSSLLAENSVENVSDQQLKTLSQAPPASRKFVRISVIDTGSGIQKEDLELIFDAFEQLENSSSRKSLGTGLGLSLTKRFVELHGGRIRAESEGEGKGSTFRFAIPA
jgi:signal transduction histidine kinase